jgi:hypothetical protein
MAFFRVKLHPEMLPCSTAQEQAAVVTFGRNGFRTVTAHVVAMDEIKT